MARVTWQMTGKLISVSLTLSRCGYWDHTCYPRDVLMQQVTD